MSSYRQKTIEMVDEPCSSKWHQTAKQLYRGHPAARKIPVLNSVSNATDQNRAIADSLNDHFTRIKDDNRSYPTCQVRTRALISSIYLTEPEVLETLISLNTTKSCGPDLIPNLFLKNCIALISEPLTKLFNQSLRTSEMPSDWKFSRVTPIYIRAKVIAPKQHLIDQYPLFPTRPKFLNLLSTEDLFITLLRTT